MLRGGLKCQWSTTGIGLRNMEINAEMISNGVVTARNVDCGHLKIITCGKKPNFTQTQLHAERPRATRVKCEDAVVVTLENKMGSP